MAKKSAAQKRPKDLPTERSEVDCDGKPMVWERRGVQQLYSPQNPDDDLSQDDLADWLHALWSRLDREAQQTLTDAGETELVDVLCRAVPFISPADENRAGELCAAIAKRHGGLSPAAKAAHFLYAGRTLPIPGGAPDAADPFVRILLFARSWYSWEIDVSGLHTLAHGNAERMDTLRSNSRKSADKQDGRMHYVRLYGLDYMKRNPTHSAGTVAANIIGDVNGAIRNAQLTDKKFKGYKPASLAQKVRAIRKKNGSAGGKPPDA